jgi:hypothetical protein
MPVTLTDEQVAELRGRLGAAETNRQIAEASAGLWNDPVFGDEAKALWKKKYPDTAIPDHDLRTELRGELAKDREQREKERKEAADRAEDERIASKRKEAQDSFGLTDDAMKRLEDFMVERNIGDYEIAAEAFVSRNPRVSDGSQEHDSHFWQHERQDLFAEISKDPEEWGRKEILKTLREQERRAPGRAW